MPQHGSQTGSPIPDESVTTCLRAIEDYRGQGISKWEAIIQIASAINSATASTDNEQRSTAGDTYLMMLTNTTSYSPRQALEVFGSPNQKMNRIVRLKKTLMERLSLSDLPHKVNHLNPSDVN